MAHQAHAGNTAAGPPWMPMIERLMEQYPIGCLNSGGRGGLLSLDTLEADIPLPSGEPLEYLMAAPRYDGFTDLSEQPVGRPATDYRPDRAEPCAAQRPRQLYRAVRAAGRPLDGQAEGAGCRGGTFSDSGAKARLYPAAKEAPWAHVIKASLKSALFTYAIDPGSARPA